jgi:energy-coupling factor transporter transmembrane protein EcfT
LIRALFFLTIYFFSILVGFFQILIFGLSGQYWIRNWVVVIGFQLGCFPPILFIWKTFVAEKSTFGRRRVSKFCYCELSRFDDDENFRIYFDYDFLR